MHDHKNNRVCNAKHGFNCVQLMTSVFLLKRRHGTNCWQPEIRHNVPVECSCMWYVALLFSRIFKFSLIFFLISGQSIGWVRKLFLDATQIKLSYTTKTHTHDTNGNSLHNQLIDTCQFLGDILHAHLTVESDQE